MGLMDILKGKIGEVPQMQGLSDLLLGQESFNPTKGLEVSPSAIVGGQDLQQGGNSLKDIISNEVAGIPQSGSAISEAINNNVNSGSTGFGFNKDTMDKIGSGLSLLGGGLSSMGQSGSQQQQRPFTPALIPQMNLGENKKYLGLGGLVNNTGYYNRYR